MELYLLKKLKKIFCRIPLGWALQPVMSKASLCNLFACASQKGFSLLSLTEFIGVANQ
jgi:hypothetical protein